MTQPSSSSGEYRILVTGSRTWTHWVRLYEELDQAVEDALSASTNIVVVHGACPKGADDYASQWCEGSAGYLDNDNIALREEAHPAEWELHGKRAGFLRNAEMVTLGANVCLAFIKDGSKGASMTADLAEKAGIPTRRFTA